MSLDALITATPPPPMTSAATAPTMAVFNLDDLPGVSFRSDGASARLGSVRWGTAVPLTAIGSAQTGVVCSVLLMVSLPRSVGPLREGRWKQLSRPSLRGTSAELGSRL
ncbi:hypothetical protein GCM10010532_074460 [Dactylosporangium siamense]|uniref:Uncharacterized protein n=1 Tax=Dactylosporangium siamense TaxID=685454 RepID=A0A919U9A9_9ACTN|nr:hypothetical protein Dsi01nite_054200 [Dactylosporangium siamense]